MDIEMLESQCFGSLEGTLSELKVWGNIVNWVII
jgi:hypothetical protein